MSEHAFIKMHGAGNDFVIFDARTTAIRLDAGQIRKIADRHYGIGCDQVIVMEKPKSDEADAFMRIYNADGVEVSSCGNASRCVGSLVLKEKQSAKSILEPYLARIETLAGVVVADSQDEIFEEISVNMGPPKFEWSDIPLARNVDTLHLDIEVDGLSNGVAVSMGNPHAVFFVDDIDQIDLATVGPELEHNELFPQRANISIAQVIDQKNIKLKVWERGSGITLACGTAACATMVAAVRRNLIGSHAYISLPGGELEVIWDGIVKDKATDVQMRGPVATSFTGTVHL